MSREKISVTLGEKLLGRIEDRVGEKYENRSEAVRELCKKGLAYDDDVQELRDDLEHVEAARDDLRRQLQEVRSREDDVEEIVEYVDEQRSVERKRAEAGIVDRTKWWLFGMDVDEDDE